MQNYEKAINKTSKNYAPWYNIPADDKLTARYLVAKTLLEVMQTYTDIQEPELAENLKLQIPSYIEQLNKE